jgi:malonyl CoA-acyl carrier protein transacylase
LALVGQIGRPVQWARSMRCLLGRGATSFKEIGPGNVLSRLVQKIELQRAA